MMIILKINFFRHPEQAHGCVEHKPDNNFMDTKKSIPRGDLKSKNISQQSIEVYTVEQRSGQGSKFETDQPALVVVGLKKKLEKPKRENDWKEKHEKRGSLIETEGHPL